MEEKGLIYREADALDKRLHADHQLHAAACAQKVPKLALGARDAYLIGVFAEDFLNSFDLADISERCRRAVCVDVIHVFGFDARIFQCVVHYLDDSGPIRMWRCDVVSVC